MNKLRIDLGCGSRKKEGTLGIDFQAEPGVDYVLNLQTESLPFPNRSVEYVHSAHLQLHHTQVELEQTQDVIKAMETSKFWKLRTTWFSFKKMVGLMTNDK